MPKLPKTASRQMGRLLRLVHFQNVQQQTHQMTTDPTRELKQEGPKISVNQSCFECRHCINESYTCQSDSGQDVYCGAMEKKRIGDTNWSTPDWCPFLPTDTRASSPADAEATGIEAEVCRDIANRQALGIAKYGVTVAGNPLPLREWLNHAYQECLDQAVYLKRAIAELDASALAVGKKK